MNLLDAVLNKDKTYNPNEGGKTAPVMNLSYGGLGYLPKIGRIGPDGKNYEEWVSNDAHVSRNVIPILLTYPKFFNYMPNKDLLIKTYKAIMEEHALTITGFNSGLELETGDNILGPNLTSKVVTKVNIAETALNMTFRERTNKTFTKFFDMFIRYGIMDPHSLKPLVSKYITNFEEVERAYLSDMYSCTMLFIEPDITQKAVVDAWLVFNMFPLKTGDRTGKRDISAAGETVELSIDFNSPTLNTPAVLTLASAVLDSLTVLNKIPDLEMILPVSGVDSTLSSLEDTGFNRK